MKFSHMTTGMALEFPMIRSAMHRWWGLYVEPGDNVRPDEFITVVTIRGRVVAFQAFQVKGKTLKSQLTYVVKNQRRKGLGKALWRESMRWAGTNRADGYAATRAGWALLCGLRRSGLKGRLDTSVFDPAPREATPLERFARELRGAG